MRILTLALALSVAPMAAHAASPDLSAEFSTVCINNRLNMPAAVGVAEARGYARMAVDTPAGTKSVTALTKTFGADRWVVIIGTGGSPAAGANPAQDFVACNVTGVNVGPGGADGVRRWAGVAASKATEAQTTYFFKESGGRHVAVDPDNNPAMIEALKAGGFYLLQIDVTGTTTAVTLTRATAAP